MKRKIIAVLMICAVCMSASACSKTVSKPSEPTPVPIVKVIPSTLLSVNDVNAKTGTGLVQDGDITENNGTSSIVYRSEPVGKADTVKVTVTQYSEAVSKDSIRQIFDGERTKRPTAEDVEGMENCFVAFPTVYYYKDGYYITITAGSGDTDEQKELLISLVQTAAANLDGFIAQ